MSDERRRGRRRAADGGGGAEADAAALTEELRAGRVTAEQVGLAALAGWPAAVAALGRGASGPPPEGDAAAASAWLALLRLHDTRAPARALVAIARARLGRRHARRLRDALHEVEGWILRRGAPRAVVAVRATDARHPEVAVIVHAAILSSVGRPVEPGPLTADDLRAAREELGPWALGGRDPVAGRWRRRRPPPPPPPPSFPSEAGPEHRAFLRAHGAIKDSYFD